MTRLQTLIAWCAVSTALLTSANAQTADDIINKYTDAIGGGAVLAEMQSMQIEGTVSAMGNDWPLRVTIVNGKGFKSEVNANGSSIVQCVTDNGGWMLNPPAGVSSPQMLSSDQAKAGRWSTYIGGPLVDYKNKGLSAELLGRVDYNGVNVYRIRLFDNAGTDVTYGLDPNTYLILKSATKARLNGVDVTETSTYSNYRKTPIGYTMAYTVAGTDLGYDMVLTYSKVEFNKEFDPRTFAVPK